LNAPNGTQKQVEQELHHRGKELYIQFEKIEERTSVVGGREGAKLGTSAKESVCVS